MPGMDKDSDHARQTRDGRGALFTLYACFFLSGVAGLIYEVLWSRYLALFVGSTGLAQVVVLATYMGGLAVGGQWIGRFSDRVRSPLLLYVWLEIAIGIYALFFDHVFAFGRMAFLAAAQAGGAAPGALVAAKILGSVLTILLPTFLMGGTMPAMARYVVRSMEGVGPRISRLYFLNSLGAVVGCLLAGFYLVRVFGMASAMMVGSVLNIVAGMAAYLVLRRETAPVQDPPPEPEAAVLPRRIFWILATCVAVSGAVSMAYEVAWIRLLTLVLGSSTYSFSLMLATFILGLSIGGWLLSLRRKTSGYTLIFGLSEAAVGITVLLSLPFYVQLPYIFNQLASSLDRSANTFGLYQISKFMLCAGVMLIPTILQGITLPAATKILMPNLKRLGRQVGHIFAINTVGTMVGVLLAGFIGLPWLGIKGTLEVAVVLNALLGVAVLLTIRGDALRRRALKITVSVLVVVGAWYALTMGPWNEAVLSSGIYRTRERIPSFASLVERLKKERRVLYYRDGVDSSVSVHDSVNPPYERRLIINGKVDASSIGDLVTQKFLGHLPLLLTTNVTDVLVIGVGSGATVGSVLTHDVRRVDVVELSAEVIEASRLFESINGRYWEDPRVRIYREDAKTFLQIVDHTYDVIISEPTNPWIAGVAGVFSHEFFRDCASRLRPDGMFLQWFQAYEMEDAVSLMVLDTFGVVFPCYTLWNPSHADMALVGSKRAYEPDFERIEQLLERSTVRDDLATMGITSPLHLLTMHTADFAQTAETKQWLGAINSDFFPVLEYIAPRGFYMGSKARGIRMLDERPRAPRISNTWLPRYLATRSPSPDEWRSCYHFLGSYAGLYGPLRGRVAAHWLRAAPEDDEAQRASMADTASHQIAQRAPQEILAADLSPEAFESLLEKFVMDDYRRRRGFLGAEQAPELFARLDTALAATPNNPDLLRWQGEVAFDLGAHAAAARSLESALALLQPRSGVAPPDVSVAAAILLVRVHLAAGNPQAAANAFTRWLASATRTLEVRLTEARVNHALDRHATAGNR